MHEDTSLLPGLQSKTRVRHWLVYQSFCSLKPCLASYKIPSISFSHLCATEHGHPRGELQDDAYNEVNQINYQKHCVVSVYF